MNKNLGHIIIKPEYWAIEIAEIIYVSHYEKVRNNSNSYSLLVLNFNNDKWHTIHLEIPEYGYHCTLVPNKYIQFHRRGENNYGTRVSYGDRSITKEFYLDGDMPWYIVPFMKHKNDTIGVLHLYMFKYKEGEDNPIFYFINDYINKRAEYKNTLKSEFVYNKEYPYMTDTKKCFNSYLKTLDLEFRPIDHQYKSIEVLL